MLNRFINKVLEIKELMEKNIQGKSNIKRFIYSKIILLLNFLLDNKNLNVLKNSKNLYLSVLFIIGFLFISFLNKKLLNKDYYIIINIFIILFITLFSKKIINNNYDICFFFTIFYIEKQIKIVFPFLEYNNNNFSLLNNKELLICMSLWFISKILIIILFDFSYRRYNLEKDDKLETVIKKSFINIVLKCFLVVIIAIIITINNPFLFNFLRYIL